MLSSLYFALQAEILQQATLLHVVRMTCELDTTCSTCTARQRLIELNNC